MSARGLEAAEVFRFQVFAAATLTVLTGGVLHDPQDGEFAPAAAVLKSAWTATAKSMSARATSLAAFVIRNASTKSGSRSRLLP